jgi:hypothetical protein
MKRTVWISGLAAAASCALFCAACACESEKVERVPDAGIDGGFDAGTDAGWEPEPPPGEDAAAERRDAGDCQGRCCALPDEVVVLASDREDADPVASLAVNDSRTGFATIDRELGECLDQMLVFELDSSSYQPEIWSLMDSCHSFYGPIIGPGDGGWLLLWVDHRDSTEVRATVYAPGEEDPVPADPFQLSESDRMERELAMTGVGDSVLVAWTEEDVRSGTWAVVTRSISPAGEPLGPATIVRESNQASFDGLDLVAMGEDGAFLLYNSGGSEPELVMQKLDAAGQVLGPFEVLADDPGPYGSAAMVWERGGAVVYALAPTSAGGEIRFRSVNAAGDLESNDQRIVSAPQEGSDPSIGRLPTGVGFMVVYRAVIKRGSETRGMIRVMSLDEMGNVLGSSDVAPASIAGNRTSLAVTSNQRVAVSWSDVYEDGRREHKLVNLWCME